MTNAKKGELVSREDGFSNALNGVGTSRDPMRQYRYSAGSILSSTTLSSMYMDNGIVQRIVDLPADEAVKSWFTVKGDPSNEMLLYLDDLGAEEKFADALRWSRLYGGSAIMICTEDGSDIEEPIEESKIENIEALRVYDMTEVFETNFTYSDDRKANYGEVELYQVNPIQGKPFYIHESRLLRFTGLPLPSRYKAIQMNWGRSVIQGLWDAVLNYSRVNNLGTNAVERMAQFSLKMPNLSQTLATVEGEGNVVKRLNNLDMSMNLLNTVVIDNEETLELFNVSLSRLPETMDQIWQVVSAETGIPMSRLFGKTPAGLNSSGGSDMENWYSLVKTTQRRKLKPHMERLVRLLFLSKKGPTNGVEPEKWVVDFEELWLPSEKERAETDEKRSNAVKNLVESGIIAPAEGRKYLKDEGFPIDEELDKVFLRKEGDEGDE